MNVCRIIVEEIASSVAKLSEFSYLFHARVYFIRERSVAAVVVGEHAIPPDKKATRTLPRIICFLPLGRPLSRLFSSISRPALHLGQKEIQAR